jgi:hypothetical protein
MATLDARFPVQKRPLLWSPFIESQNANTATRLASPTIRLGDAMPVRETKQQIEAELNACEPDRVRAKFRRLIADWNEFEMRLRHEERKIWQPHWSHHDPYTDRFLRIGMNPQLAAEIGGRLAHLGDIVANRQLPPYILAEIYEINAAGDSALDQLKALIDARKK